MAIEMIKPGRNLNPKMIGTCDYCGAVYRADQSDLTLRHDGYNSECYAAHCQTEGCKASVEGWVDFEEEKGT